MTKPKLLRWTPLLLATVTGLLPQPGSAQEFVVGTEEQLTQQLDHPAVITRHRGVFGGVPIRYTATVEPVVITSGLGGSKARLVSFAYTRDGGDPKKRPVMFLFNGGPIVSSPYVHIGGLGPKRIAFPDDVKADPSTFKLVDNAHSPLDAVDLVFIDPASTGFSRVMPGTKPEDYFSVPADAAQFAGFIRAWLAAHGRQGAPVYLFGESYGTNRAAMIAAQLSEGPDPLPLAGIFLYGQALNIIEYAQRPNNIISYAASLPTIADIALYHGKARANGRTSAQFMADARTYAQGTYLTALYRGSALPQTERTQVAARLEEFSGIPAAWYLDHDLRITKEQYRIELMRAQGLLLGRNDARYVASIGSKGGAPDPSDVLTVAVNRFFAAYLKKDLKVDWAEPYIQVAPVRGLQGWGWGFGTSPFGDWPYQRGITQMMRLNPAFKLIVANGMYDTQTTMGAAEYLVTQSGWNSSQVKLRYYDGGHMGYSVEATAKAMGDDIRTFVQ
ncbi:MAG TPA: peptidase S10 [Sphingobium sp.]